MKIAISLFFILFSLQIAAQNVGIGTATPTARLHVADSAVLFQGPSVLPSSTLFAPPVSGQGVRFMWYPQKAAFRAGFVSGDRWDKDNIGMFSMALGSEVMAKGDYSTSMGYSTSASGLYSTSMGVLTTANGDVSTSMGFSTNAGGPYSTSLGFQTDALGFGSTSMGRETTSSGNNSTSMGYLTNAIGPSSTSMGEYTGAFGSAATSMGSVTFARGSSSTSMGNYTTANGFAATSMGNLTTANANYSTSMGLSTRTSGIASMVMGSYNIARSDNTLVIGTYNDTSLTNSLFEIGNGTADNVRKNALTVLANGKIGIGSTNPSNPISFPPTLEKKISFYPGATGDVGIAVSGNDLRIYSDNVNARVSFGYDNYTTGFVSRAFVPATGTNAMVIQGNLLVNATTYSSDARFKQHIRPLTGALEKVIALQGVQYEMRVKEFPEHNFQSGTEIGLIAQEVEKVLPELVRTDTDGYKSVDYAKLVPVLIESIKAQQQQIQVQQQKLDQQHSDFQKLQEKLEQLLRRVEQLEQSKRQ